MKRRPSVVLLSIFVHAIVLGALGTAPWWSPISSWPMPHEVLAFSGSPRLEQVQDIELPRPPRTNAGRAPAAGAAVATELAPVVATTGVAPETGREGPPASRSALAIESGPASAIEGVGAPSAPPPPPEPPKPAAPVRVPSLLAPKKVAHVAPQYPAVARTARVEGVVIIETIIDTMGNVQSASVLRSIPLLDQAALDAVRQWKFTPTLLNGVPVPVVLTVTVYFKLSD